MFSSVTAHAELNQLNREIEQSEANLTELELLRKERARAVGVADRKLNYYRLARILRGPGKAYPAWRLSLLICAPIASVAISFVLADLFWAGPTISIVICFLSAVIVEGVLLKLFFSPNDDRLAEESFEAEKASNEVHDQLAGVAERIANVAQRLASMTNRRQQVVSSIELRREMLLRQNWKAMRDEEWETFLVEVFEALGAVARRVGKSGDQGVDLIVKYGMRRIAIQAKGYLDKVNNKAVQEAYTGARHWDCDACAVFTNSRFTSGAEEIAASTGCVLIGEYEFPDFVRGRLPLFEIGNQNSVQRG
jgi:hypothetical protein